MRRKGPDEAWNALESMQQQGVPTDKFTVSRMLMKTVGDGRGRPLPTKVYRGIALVERFMQLQPEEADEVLFNALLDTCCRMKDLGRLEATMQRMNELRVHPSHVTLGILVKGYGQAGDITRVLQVWDSMAEQRQQANAVTSGCMIDACVKCGSLDKAMEIFEMMKAKKRHRNTILYTTLIKGYGLEKDLGSAMTLFREMSKESVPYNSITYNSMIDVCIKCGDLHTAEELMREMMAPGSAVEPDLITYSTLLKGYCQGGDLDKALQVAETIKACGLKCDELVYNTLMDGCVKVNDLSAGIGLFAEMAQAQMQPSGITHSILVRLYQRNGHRADAADAVDQLYSHHGLQRPQGAGDGRGRGGGNRRRGGDGRQGQQGQQQDRRRIPAKGQGPRSSGGGDYAGQRQPPGPVGNGYAPGPPGQQWHGQPPGALIGPGADQRALPPFPGYGAQQGYGEMPYMPMEALQQSQHNLHAYGGMPPHLAQHQAQQGLWPEQMQGPSPHYPALLEQQAQWKASFPGEKENHPWPEAHRMGGMGGFGGFDDEF